jgi:predicted SnoaL-like aldol condensation-catalyzing enzyme
MHPNMALLMKLDLQNLETCKDLFSSNFTWHYFNLHLPDMEGDYHGVEGLTSFFSKLRNKSDSTFRVNVVDGRPAGDELVVTQVCNCMNLDGRSIEFDAVVVWRIVDNRLAEAWDIPAVNTIRALQE